MMQVNNKEDGFWARDKQTHRQRHSRHACMILFVSLKMFYGLKNQAQQKKALFCHKINFLSWKIPAISEQTQKNTQQETPTSKQNRPPFVLVLQLLLLLLLFLPRPALPTIIRINARPFPHSLQFSLNKIFKYLINNLALILIFNFAPF